MTNSQLPICPIHGSNADVLWNPNNPTASLPNAGIFCRLFGYSQSKIFTLRMPQWDLPRFPDYKKGGNISNKIMIQHSNSLKHSFYCWRYFQIRCIFNGSMVHRVNKSWFMSWRWMPRVCLYFSDPRLHHIVLLVSLLLSRWSHYSLKIKVIHLLAKYVKYTF